MRRAAYLILALAAVGVASPDAELVRLRIGPLYVLEALLILFAAAVACSRSRPRLADCRAAGPAALFFAWGLARLLFGGELAAGGDTARTLQHALLFVYPLVWMLAGIWLAQTDRAVTALLILVILAVNTAPNFTGALVSNLSLGPLSAVVLVVCVDKAMAGGKKSAEGLIYWVIAAGLALLTFAPYWRLWYLKTYMQRTTLLMLVFMLITTPLLRRKKLSSIKNALITLPVLVLGFALAGFFSTAAGSASQTVGEHLADNIVESLDKAGGYLDPHPSPLAMVSVRKFWWHTAVDDWRTSPVIGVGFIPEVPSLLAPGVPNTRQSVREHHEYGSSAPVSGPHNSYLTILARMGVIGFGLFALVVGSWLVAVWPLVRGRELNLYEILVLMLPISGALHAFLNVGFETPRYAMLTWLFAGAATVYGKALADAQAAANSRD